MSEALWSPQSLRYSPKEFAQCPNSILGRDVKLSARAMLRLGRRSLGCMREAFALSRTDFGAAAGSALLLSLAHLPILLYCSRN